MKNYLKLLTVALFAAMSFALVSCGNDEDEPNDGNGKAACSLTIDGKKFPAKNISAEIAVHNGVNYLTVWVNTALDDNYFIFETPDEDFATKIENGADVSDYCNIDFDFDDDYCLGATVSSGSVIITNFSRENKTVTVTFNNCKVTSMGGIGDDDYVISGSFTSPIKGAGNTTKL